MLKDYEEIYVYILRWQRESLDTYVRVFFFSLYLIFALSLACGLLASIAESQGSPVRNMGDRPQSW